MTGPSSLRATLFRENGNQAIRIPAEFELPGDAVLISRDGKRLIIEPVKNVAELMEWMRAQEPLGPEDQFPDDIRSSLLPLKDVDL